MSVFENDAVPIGAQDEVYAILEDTAGTFKAPTGAKVVRVVGAGEIAQERPQIPDPQRRFQFSRRVPKSGRFNAGTFNFPFLIKPSGTLGTAPQNHDILKAAWMNYANVPSTSDTYKPLAAGSPVPTLSIYVYTGDLELIQMAGCGIDELDVDINTSNDESGLLQLKVSGMGMRARRCGSAAVTVDLDGSTDDTITVGVPAVEAFEVETRVSVVDNGVVDSHTDGLGYLISSINYSTGVITLARVVDTAHDATSVAGQVWIRPWRPTAAESGDTLHGAIGQTIANDGDADEQRIELTKLALKIKHSIEIPNDRQHPTDLYPRKIYRTQPRDVSGEIEAYLDATMLKFARRYREIDTDTLVAEVLNQTTGSSGSIQFYMDNVAWGQPSDSGDGLKKRTIPFMAYESSAGAEDEMRMVIAAALS